MRTYRLTVDHLQLITFFIHGESTPAGTSTKWMITGFIAVGLVRGLLPNNEITLLFYITQKMIFISIEPKDANAKYGKTKFTRFSLTKAHQNLFL